MMLPSEDDDGSAAEIARLRSALAAVERERDTACAIAAALGQQRDAARRALALAEEHVALLVRERNEARAKRDVYDDALRSALRSACRAHLDAMRERDTALAALSASREEVEHIRSELAHLDVRLSDTFMGGYAGRDLEIFRHGMGTAASAVSAVLAGEQNQAWLVRAVDQDETT